MRDITQMRLKWFDISWWSHLDQYIGLFLYYKKRAMYWSKATQCPSIESRFGSVWGLIIKIPLTWRVLDKTRYMLPNRPSNVFTICTWIKVYLLTALQRESHIYELSYDSFIYINTRSCRLLLISWEVLFSGLSPLSSVWCEVEFVGYDQRDVCIQHSRETYGSSKDLCDNICHP